MHKFWDVPELVLGLLSFLSKAGRVRISQVNRRLWEIAITQIWSDVPDLRQFLRLLPSDLHSWINDSVPEPSSLLRPIRETDLDRLILHSRSTISLGCVVDTSVSAALEAICNHAKLPDAFPNLQTLEIQVVGLQEPSPRDTISPFVRPSLRKVELLSDYLLIGRQFHTLFQKIAQMPELSLRYMDVNCSRGMTGLVNDAYAAICSQRHLRTLRLHTSQGITELVDAAKDLPLLAELDLRGLTTATFTINDEPIPTCGESFSSLVTLSARGDPLGLYKLLRNVTSPVITRILLIIDIRSLCRMLPDLFRTLLRFESSSQELTVRLTGILKWEDLKPLLEVRGLDKFYLKCLHALDAPPVDDSGVLDMTNSWPNLTSLAIRSWTNRSLITLLGLGYIASNCPKLRWLSLTFDGRKESNDEEPQVCEPQHVLESIDILSSQYDPGDEQRLITNYLRCWWPRARIVGSLQEESIAKVWQDLGRCDQGSGETDGCHGSETRVSHHIKAGS